MDLATESIVSEVHGLCLAVLYETAPLKPASTGLARRLRQLRFRQDARPFWDKIGIKPEAFASRFDTDAEFKEERVHFDCEFLAEVCEELELRQFDEIAQLYEEECPSRFAIRLIA